MRTVFDDDLGTLFVEPNIMDNISATALPEEARQCNPSLPIEMKDVASRMRGDAIGNTLYSECWVIKVLMKLARFCSEEWSKDMEIELCLLWDMTVEADVAEFLLQHDFLDLSCQIINDTTNPRLTEILVGIMGNLSCVASVRAEIAKKVKIIHLLLELLSLPDVPTLLQLMRLLQSCVSNLMNVRSETGSRFSPIEQSMLHENRTNTLTESESVTEFSKSEGSPSFCHRVDEKVHKFPTLVADAECVEHTDSISGQNSVKLDQLDEVARHLQSCVVDVDQSRLQDSCTLQDSGHKQKLHNVEPLVLEPEETDRERDGMSGSKDERLELNEGTSKEKSEVDSLWLQELYDVNKWLPSIVFILRSSTNGLLIDSTLRLLYMLCEVPINDDLLRIHIASPEIVLALVESFEQLHGYTSSDDLYPDVNVEAAMCNWAGVLHSFASFPAGNIVLGSHVEALCTALCRHLAEYKLPEQLSASWAEFILLVAGAMTSLLEVTGYFHPPLFNCFLSILTCLKGRGIMERNGSDRTKKILHGFAMSEMQLDAVAALEKYFVAVVQSADGGALANVLQHCDEEHVTILQSVMGGQKSP